MEQQQDWRWTLKGPALIVGLVLTFAGLLLFNGRWRWSIPAAAALLVAGFLTVMYSTTVHGWCAPVDARFGNMAFGSGYWHGPSAWDCWHLVNPMGPRR